MVRERWLGVVLGVSLVLGGGAAQAADAGATAPRGSDAGAADASARPPNPHLRGGGPGAAEADDEADEAVAPHGHGAKGHGADAMFQPPEDGAAEDPTLPVGTLTVRIVDPSEKPIPSVPVTVGILENSVAKGESRKRVNVVTNQEGIARLDHLDTGSTVAYRPMVMTDGATFSAMPFRMPDGAGMKAVLHVYPVVEDVENALVVSQSILYAEVKDDRIQVQQAFKIYNLGKTAWVPKDVVIALPETFTAFTSQQGMSDIGVDAVPKQGARIRGTFVPGQHMVEFRWQLPYSGESEVRFDVGQPPHMAAARVIAPASKDMHLEVPGFPPPQPTNDGMGQRALITEKQIRRDEPPVKNLTVVIRGLPTEGSARIVATAVSLGGVLVGLVLATRKPPRRDRKAERARLLDELTELERAHSAGDVGPKTYERARREILDALARTFGPDGPSTRTRSAGDGKA